jgi:hypothetical protein
MLSISLSRTPPEMLPGFVAETQQQLAPLRQADGFHERWRIICVLCTGYSAAALNRRQLF